MSLIVLKMTVESSQIEIGYDSLNDLLSDTCLRVLFDEGLVSDCSVYSYGKRIVGLPFMEWDRLRDAVISNSTTILRGV